MKTFHHPAPLAFFTDPSPGYSVCCVFPTSTTAGNAPVKLEQHKRRKHNSFRVTYGQEVHDECTYEQAAAEYGQAVMHGLACDFKLDNDRD